MIPASTHKAALRPFLGYRPTGAGLRRSYEAVNGVLMGFLCVVKRAVEAVLGKVAAYG
jgi:hypothetical protein